MLFACKQVKSKKVKGKRKKGFVIDYFIRVNQRSSAVQENDYCSFRSVSLRACFVVNPKPCSSVLICV